MDAQVVSCGNPDFRYVALPTSSFTNLSMTSAAGCPRRVKSFGKNYESRCMNMAMTFSWLSKACDRTDLSATLLAALIRPRTLSDLTLLQESSDAFENRS